LPNYRYNRDWCAMLDAFLYMAFPRAEKVLLGCRDSCLEIYRKDGWNNTQYLDTLDQFAGVSATVMREQIAERDTEDFRAGVIYGVQSACPRVLPAVDIAIYKQDPKVIDGNFIPRTQLLVVRKQGEAQWRFPGGALEAADPTLEAGARREGYEETGLALDTLEYVSGRRIDDWRFRRTGITVFTTFFSAPWMGGTPKPKDREIADARWIRATSVIEVTLVEEHLVLYQDFLDWLTKKETKSVEHHAADRLLQAES
jgi:8-oxo-dGTP pyrophosphatase MutT (NUDIX family)